MEYSKEFKQALSEFSPIEKDRLIFRLLKKDKLLS
ncbi:MAG TPA: deoxyuridine 5'-triphosphate nucleotidohydrolase, partial [Chryseobacterium sp.]|nr:deoxyuridine 5'-triphosphate nucleotidohydrolase [Chryseobacterium sp.]